MFPDHSPFILIMILFSRAGNWRNYSQAKRDAKKAVSVAKVAHYDDVGKKLDNSGRSSDLRLAKFSKKQAKDSRISMASMTNAVAF